MDGRNCFSSWFSRQERWQDTCCMNVVSQWRGGNTLTHNSNPIRCAHGSGVESEPDAVRAAAHVDACGVCGLRWPVLHHSWLLHLDLQLAGFARRFSVLHLALGGVGGSGLRGHLPWSFPARVSCPRLRFCTQYTPTSKRPWRSVGNAPLTLFRETEEAPRLTSIYALRGLAVNVNKRPMR